MGVTRLTREDVTGGDRRWRTGTYREGGGGTEADLLHGAEEQAAGGHAPLAPRLGEGRLRLQAGAPSAQLGSASLPGRGRLLPQWEPGSASLHPPVPPSSPPSFPPSLLGIQSSSHHRIPTGSRYQGPSHGPAPILVPVKVGRVSGGGEEGTFPTPCSSRGSSAPQNKGISILLTPRSCSPRRGTRDPRPGGAQTNLPPQPHGHGGQDPACVSGVQQTPPSRRETQDAKGPWAIVLEEPQGQQEPLDPSHLQKCPGETEAQSTPSRTGPTCLYVSSVSTQHAGDSTVPLCPVWRKVRACGPRPGPE